MTPFEALCASTTPECIPSFAALDQKVRQRALGAYYTPDRLSAVVAAWAISSSEGSVLEPGFGGCGFLLAAKQRLEMLGQKHPSNFIYGCDIDKDAFEHLHAVFDAKPSPHKFPHADFLNMRPGEAWGGARFKVALGNPPYVSYQSLGSRRQEYQAILRSFGWKLPARASLWAYFVLHALSFLQVGGRVAWVLPGSVMRANYARYVKQVIADRFAKSALFHVHERLFSPAGAEEETVILVADGFEQAKPGGAIASYSVKSVDELGPALLRWHSGTYANELQSAQAIGQHMLGQVTGLATIVLSDLLKVRIGLVTGDNSFFLFSKLRAQEERIPLVSLKPLLSKGGMAPGLSFSAKDFMQATKADYPCYLLSAPRFPASQVGINRYLNTYPKEKIEKVSTFRKRPRWHEPADQNVPDAFWPVMREGGPKLVLNPLRLHCTNTLHRVFFAPAVRKVQQKLLAVCLQSTYAQVQAEICGRSYGAGVLKHEPRDVERIRIPWPTTPEKKDIEITFRSIDTAMRRGRYMEARRLADAFIERCSGPVYNEGVQATLSEVLLQLRNSRKPKRVVRAYR